jgi:hypothetical protein
MLEFLDFQVNVCPGQAGRIKAIEVTGRMTGKPEVIPGQKSASGKSADVDLATLDAIAFCAG